MLLNPHADRLRDFCSCFPVITYQNKLPRSTEKSLSGRAPLRAQLRKLTHSVPQFQNPLTDGEETSYLHPRTPTPAIGPSGLKGKTSLAPYLFFSVTGTLGTCTQHPLGQSIRPFSAPLDATNPTQQGRHAAAMRPLATITVAIC